MTKTTLIKGILPLLFPFIVFLFEQLDIAPIYGLGLTLGAVLLFLKGESRTFLGFKIGLLVVLTAAIFLFDQTRIPRVYPFLISASFLLLFCRSLKEDESQLERFSKIFVKVSPKESIFLKRVTPIWIFGIGLNTAVLGLFLFGFETKIWLLYAGFLSYIWLVLLFIVTLILGLITIGSPRGKSPIARIVFGAKIYTAFAIFGLTSIFFTGVLPMIYIVALGHRKRFRRFSQVICNLGFKLLLGYTRRLGLVNIRFIEHPGFTFNQIIIANHISLLDVVAILAHFPTCSTFVNSKFLNNPIIGFIIKACGFIPLDGADPSQRAQGYMMAYELLRQGRHLVIFPEGTRSKDGYLQEFQAGIFRLALRAQKNITPIFITCDYPVLNKTDFVKPHASVIQFRLHLMPEIKIPGDGYTTKWQNQLHKGTLELYNSWLRSDICLDWNKYKIKTGKVMNDFTISFENPHKLIAQYNLREDHRHFKGHFEGFPVFPAVAQIELIRELLAATSRGEVGITAIKRSKFLNLLRPNTKLQILLEFPSNGGEGEQLLKWLIQDRTQVYSKGSLWYESTC